MIAEALDECATLGGFSSSDSADSPSKQSNAQSAKLRHVSSVNAWPNTGDFLLKSGRLSKRTRRNSGDFVEPSSISTSCKKRKTETRVSSEKPTENRVLQKETTQRSEQNGLTTNEGEKIDANVQGNANSQSNRLSAQSNSTSRANSSVGTQVASSTQVSSSTQATQPANPSANGEIKSVEKTKTPKSTWTLDEKVAFFDGVREFGRNFEALASYIAQKTANTSRSSSARANSKSNTGVVASQPKTRDQVRHFYYRTWQKVANLTNQHLAAASQHRNDASNAHTTENGAANANARTELVSTAGRVESADDAANPTGWAASAISAAPPSGSQSSAPCSNTVTAAQSQPGANGTRRNVELASLIAYGVLKTRFAKLSVLAKQKKLGDRIQELVRNGNTVIKFGGKSHRIRMPHCRALSHTNANYADSLETLADGSRAPNAPQRNANAALRRNGSAVRPARAATRNECVIDALPDEVFIELRPRSAHAFRRVQAVGHNPRLRIAVGTNRSLNVLTDFLNARWRAESDRLPTAAPDCEPNASFDCEPDSAAPPHADEPVGSVLLFWPRSLLRTLRELSNRTVRIASRGPSHEQPAAHTLDFSRLVSFLESGFGSKQAAQVTVLQLYLLARILNVQSSANPSTNAPTATRQPDVTAARHSQPPSRSVHPPAGRSLNFAPPTPNSSLGNAQPTAPHIADEQTTSTPSNTATSEYVVPLEFDFRDDYPLRQVVVDNILLRLLQFATVEYFSFDRNAASRASRTATRTSKTPAVQRQSTSSGTQPKSNSHAQQPRAPTQPKRTYPKEGSTSSNNPPPPIPARAASDVSAANGELTTTTIDGNNMLVAIVPRRCGTSTIVQRRILPKPLSQPNATADPATSTELSSKQLVSESNTPKPTPDAPQPVEPAARQSITDTDSAQLNFEPSSKQQRSFSKAPSSGTPDALRDTNDSKTSTAARQAARQSKAACGTRPDDSTVGSSPRRSWKKFNSWLSNTFAGGTGPEESCTATSSAPSSSDVAIRSKLRGDPLLTNTGRNEAACDFVVHADELDGGHQMLEHAPATSVFDDSSMSLATFLGLRSTSMHSQAQPAKEDGCQPTPKDSSFTHTPVAVPREPAKECDSVSRPNGASTSHTYMIVRDGMLVPSSSEQFDLSRSSTRITDTLGLQPLNCTPWLPPPSDSVPNGSSRPPRNVPAEIDPHEDSNLQMEPSGGDVLNTPSKKRRSEPAQSRTTLSSSSELPSMLDECSTMSVGAYWETLGFGSALRAAGFSTASTNDASIDVAKR